MANLHDPMRASALLDRLQWDNGIIAMIGASAKPERASHQVMAFLQGAGLRVIPVNPASAKPCLAKPFLPGWRRLSSRSGWLMCSARQRPAHPSPRRRSPSARGACGFRKV